MARSVCAPKKSWGRLWTWCPRDPWRMQLQAIATQIMAWLLRPAPAAPNRSQKAQTKTHTARRARMHQTTRKRAEKIFRPAAACLWTRVCMCWYVHDNFGRPPLQLPPWMAPSIPDDFPFKPQLRKTHQYSRHQISLMTFSIKYILILVMNLFKLVDVNIFP